MGTWGYGLYQNDLSCDVKESFLENLKNDDYDCIKATEKTLAEYAEELKDIDEGSLVWITLADIQWNKGLLLDFVKEEAIKCIDSELDLPKWKETPKLFVKRKQVLDKLKVKLLSEQPQVKKPRVPRNFVCKWNLGDTFAYKLTSQYALEKGLMNRYFIFHKVGEVSGYPLEIYPVVFVKLTKDDKLPTCKDEIDGLEFVQISIVSELNPELDSNRWNMLRLKNALPLMDTLCERDEFGYVPNYKIALSFTSQRNIPKEMIFLGNFDLASPKINYQKQKVQQIMWKFAEEIIIDRYIGFNLRNSPLYNKRPNK